VSADWVTAKIGANRPGRCRGRRPLSSGIKYAPYVLVASGTAERLKENYVRFPATDAQELPFR
jgi:hypothetical protein